MKKVLEQIEKLKNEVLADIFNHPAYHRVNKNCRRMDLIARAYISGIDQDIPNRKRIQDDTLGGLKVNMVLQPLLYATKLEEQLDLALHYIKSGDTEQLGLSLIEAMPLYHKFKISLPEAENKHKGGKWHKDKTKLNPQAAIDCIKSFKVKKVPLKDNRDKQRIASGEEPRSAIYKAKDILERRIRKRVSISTLMNCWKMRKH